MAIETPLPPETESPLDPLPPRRRWPLALAVLLVALAVAAILQSQPSQSRLTGVCIDYKTGEPLAGVNVSLSRSGDEPGYEQRRFRNHGIKMTDALGNTTAPSGWSQDSENDEMVSLSGASSTPRTDWQEETDDHGRFTFPRVPAGMYHLDADATSHTYPERTVALAEGQPERLTLAMRRSGPSLSFETATFAWMPGETPTLGLRGLMPNKTVTFTLERLDKAGMLRRSPVSLVQPSADAYGATPPKTWPGEFTLVRRWTYVVKDAGPEGDFFDRIALENAANSPLPLGMYRITADATEANATVEATGWASVTDLALINKMDQHHLLSYVVDIQTGKPVSGVPVTLYNEEKSAPKTLVSVVTSAQGEATLSALGADKESQGILIARRGDAVAGLAINLNSADEGRSDSDESAAPSALAAASTLRSFIYTERPVYRPGQTVYLKGVMRLFSNQSGFTLPANQAVTLDVRDAQDTLVSHQQVTTNAMGSWTAQLTLSSEALTGEYTIHAVMDDQTGEATFSVAAYHKPEYQAAITFSKDRYIHGEVIDGTVTATYYYGAPVAGAKVHLNGNHSGDDSSRQKFGDADGESDAGEPLLDQDVILDANGQAHFQIATANQPNTLSEDSYSIDADVDDNSGHTVDATASVTVAQGDFSLELASSSSIAHKGDGLTASATATDSNGKPRSGQHLTVMAEYDAWKDGKDVTIPVAQSDAVTGADGTAHVAVTATQIGLLVLRASGKDARGNQVSSETEVWVPGKDEEISTRYSDLSLVMDQDRYTPGQTAHLLINTDHPGPTALVTVEGATLYQQFTVPLARNSTDLNLPVTLADAPGVTVAVCCIKDKQFFQSTASLTVNDPQRPLNISVTPDKPRYHPGEAATVRVMTTDAQGRPVPAEVSVGIVDSAVYAIQPESATTINEALEPDQGDFVQTSDSCERVYLGDVDKGATNIDIRRKFPDTALWQPDMMTGQDGTALVHLAMPDTLTTWRVTCIGHTKGTQAGKGVAAMIVAKDLLVRLETPPFLTAGDTSTLVALVHNSTGISMQATTHLSAPGLSVQGDMTQTITVGPNQPARLTWTVTAPNATTPVNLQLTAASGRLSDGIEEAVPIVPHGAYQSVWHSGTLLKRISRTITLDPNAIPDQTRVRVRLSASLSATLIPAVDYLASYPYGSTDSVVSVLLPDVVLTGADRGVAPALPLSAGKRTELHDMAQRSLLRLYRLQSDQGGWGWFSTSQPDLWMTAYATWGLEQAQASGLIVTPSVLSAALDSTARLADTEQHEHSYPDRASIALASYVLARGGKSEDALKALAFLERSWRGNPLTQGNVDVALAALAYHALGVVGQIKASELMESLWSIRRETGSLCSWTAGFHRTQLGVGEDEPDAQATAWVLLAAQAITPSDPRIDKVAAWLASNRTGDHWAAPWTTAVSVLGLTAYLAASHELEPDFDAQVIVNGKLMKTVRFGPASIDEPEPVIDLPAASLHPGANDVTLTKIGQGRLYYALETRQCLSQPRPPLPDSFLVHAFKRLFHPAADALPPAPSGYRLKRVTLRLTTRRNFFWEDTVPTPETHYNEGDSILVRLIIDCTRPASHVIVEDPVPAGCEIAETPGEFVEDWSNWWDYTDVRDDKIVFFIGDLTRGEHEIDYHLLARQPGAYDIMPTHLASEADPTVQALGSANRITVDAK